MAIKPSLSLALFLLLSHAIVAMVVCVTALPLAARLSMLAPILLSLLYYLLRDALLLFPDSLCEISFDHDHISVATRDHSSFFGQAAITVNPHFLCICLKEYRLYRTIFSDALEQDAFRELRVRLKFL